MTSKIWNKWHHWERRAEECQCIAETLIDPLARQTLFNIAREYMELAQLARAAHLETLPRYYYRERG
jgi:hypothetical protein